MKIKYLMIALSYFIILFSLMHVEGRIDNNDVNISKVEVIAENNILINIEISTAMMEKIKHQGGDLFLIPNNCNAVAVPHLNYSLKLVEGNQYLLEIFDFDWKLLNLDRNSLCLNAGINHSMHPFNGFYSGKIGPIKLKETKHVAN